MELGNDTLEDGNSLSGISEVPTEKSEKQRESAKKAQSQLQKTQKDEKKARSDNNDLFFILTKFIQNPLYEELIPGVVLLLEKGVTSRFILTVTALLYPESALYILTKIGKHHEIQKMMNIYKYPEKTIFHEQNLDMSIRDWISFWMMFSKEFLLQESGSVILDVKLIDILSTIDRQKIRQVLWLFFHFFFEEKNVNIQHSKSETYAEFIISEFEKEIQKKLLIVDPNLKNSQSIDADMLF